MEQQLAPGYKKAFCHHIQLHDSPNTVGFRRRSPFNPKSSRLKLRLSFLDLQVSPALW
jgi:hypothetical protein